MYIAAKIKIFVNIKISRFLKKTRSMYVNRENEDLTNIRWTLTDTWKIKIHVFFISDTFISSTRLKLAKNQANDKHPKAELLLFENYSHSSSTLSSKTREKILKNKQKNICVCVHKIIRLIIMKMKMKIKNRSHRYNINRSRSRDEHKYSKYKKCLSMMMLIFIKKHLSNIWSSIQEKVKQYWGWVGKKRCLEKKRVFILKCYDFNLLWK